MTKGFVLTSHHLGSSLPRRGVGCPTSMTSPPPTLMYSRSESVDGRFQSLESPPPSDFKIFREASKCRNHGASDEMFLC